MSGSPSSRWNAQHGGRGRKRRAGYPGKMMYARRSGARIALVRLVFRDVLRLRWQPMCTYRCRWGPDYRDGETAPAHWHVGHCRPRGLRTRLT